MMKMKKASQKAMKKAVLDERNALFGEALLAVKTKTSIKTKGGLIESKGRDADEPKAKGGQSKAMKMMFQMDAKEMEEALLSDVSFQEQMLDWAGILSGCCVILNTLLCYSQHCAVLYCTIMYCTMQYCTMQYCTIQRYTLHRSDLGLDITRGSVLNCNYHVSHPRMLCSLSHFPPLLSFHVAKLCTHN